MTKGEEKVKKREERIKERKAILEEQFGNVVEFMRRDMERHMSIQTIKREYLGIKFEKSHGS